MCIGTSSSRRAMEERRSFRACAAPQKDVRILFIIIFRAVAAMVPHDERRSDSADGGPRRGSARALCKRVSPRPQTAQGGARSGAGEPARTVAASLVRGRIQIRRGRRHGRPRVEVRPGRSARPRVSES